MGSSPAFQFYATDWMASVSSMTLEERGAYITLLAWSWEHGPVPNDIKRIASILGVHVGHARRVFKEVQKRWRTGEDGWWFNERLEKVRDDQAAFIAAKSIRGKAGAAARWQKPCSSNAASNAASNAQAMPRGMPGGMLGDGSPISDLRSPDHSPHTDRSESVTRATGAALLRPIAFNQAYHVRNCPPWAIATACAQGFCIPKYLWPKWEARLSGPSEAASNSLRLFVEDVMRSSPPMAGDREEEFWPRQFGTRFGSSEPTTKPGRGARTAAAFDAAAAHLRGQS